jgi:hypothetical protein
MEWSTRPASPAHWHLWRCYKALEREIRALRRTIRMAQRAAVARARDRQERLAAVGCQSVDEVIAKYAATLQRRDLEAL